MFIVFFLFFIFILTFFENLLLGIIFFAIIMLLISCLNIFGILKNRKYLIFGFVSFVLAFVSVLIKHYLYFSNGIHNSGFYQGNGQIIDFLGEGKYLYQDDINNTYIFKSDTSYNVGDEIYSIGYLSSTYTGSNLLSNFNLAFNFNFGFDYNKWLFMKNYHGTIYDNNSIVKGNTKVSIISSVKNRIRINIIDTYGQGRHSGLILGMLIGDKSYFSQSDYQMFIDSGLVHIIAVSGGNIIMIVIFLNIVLFFLPFYIRLFVILFVISFYSIVCGLDSSVFRAWIMGGLGLIALLFGREINIWRLLSYAAFVMLMINPYFLVYDLGFLLSYSAIFGLVILSNIRNRFPKFKSKILGKILDEYVLANIGASIGVFPIIIFFIGKMNLASILANFVVLPIVGFVMIYGFLSIYLFKLFGLEIFLLIEQLLIDYIYFIGDFFANNGLYVVINNLFLKIYYIIVFSFTIIVFKLFFNKIKIVNKQKIDLEI